ncbi:GNAT family N-acetyltransferase [Actinoallomurus sp. NBC_01490]|uniref:GNAT family N-acetyltransferase n=1 Tax=Actinoallomurus sp. NBC_01490 TaxID=2903557 RepID=UPI002E34131E|nr:GNAT family N-acetyltransferase [Actinoallomurus sp. NBC_01490]
MYVRGAADGDLRAIAEIALANDDGDGADPRYVAHLRAHGRFLVAATDETVGGYCAVRHLGGLTLLCDLFVDPARHGGGTGRRLLDAAFDADGERSTFASRDPRAMSLYVRYGMVPRWPLLYLEGTTSFDGPAGGGVRAEAVSVAVAAAAERELNGRDRSADYAFWAATPGSTGLLVRDGDAVAAAGIAGPDRLFHLVTADGADPVATLRAALATFTAARVRLCLPGPHPALPLLLDARWRIEDADQHMSSRPDLLRSADVLSSSLA